MISPYGEQTISDAVGNGTAILKFISPNDAGVTGSHQAGILLPKGAWQLFTPYPPEKGKNTKHDIRITWPDGRITDSVVTWYGQHTRAEFRLTRFGRDFPWLNTDSVGSLIVLVPLNISEFKAHVLDLEEDIDGMMAALGVQPFEHWAIYGVPPKPEDEEECRKRKFNEFAATLTEFPSGEKFSQETIRILKECLHAFVNLQIDDALLEALETEYALFRRVERQLCQSEITRLFKDIDDFLHTARTILNRRMTRAGRSLENHVDYFLDTASVPHEVRPREIDGKPDLVIPSKEAYLDRSYPLAKLFVVGVKTTCKDRWRQVLSEARRVPRKHILTIQPAISVNQLTEMHQAGITLIVPNRLQSNYPTGHPLRILGFEEFTRTVRTALAS